jgi:hypothetical protein
MDELLKQIFCSVGATYLVLRFGHCITSLADHLGRKRTHAKAKRIDSDRH